MFKLKCLIEYFTLRFTGILECCTSHQCSILCFQLMAHASSVKGEKKAKPTNLTIIVADQNDNRPVFIENPFNGHVSESASIGKQTDQ